MAYRPTFISFAPSYECNLACAHCCVPKGTADTLPLRVALDCVQEAPALGITAVGFTGGEPMLVCDWVAEVTREARRLQLEVNDLSTNGVWWEGLSDLERALATLKEAGFVPGFHLSVDAFHAGSGSGKQAEFVQAAVRVFGQTGNVSCAESPKHSATPALRRLGARLGGKVVEESDETGRLLWGDQEMPYFRFPVADVGQRSGVGVSTGSEWFGEFDCFGHDSVYVDPDGNAHFCLGFASYAARPLWLGRVGQDGMAQVISEAAENPLIRLLCAEGPAGLRRVIEEREPGAFDTPWVSPCAFCYHCLTDDRLGSVLNEAGILPQRERT
jgi:hypothetical protein